MTHPTAALALVWLMLLCCGCGADVLDGGWQFRESVELPEVPASDAGADTPIDEDPDLDEEPDLDDDPEPVEPIERICDGNLPPEMAVSEAGEDALAYSLAIGPDGCPHVAWSADDTIHYARWDGSAWVDEVVYGPSHWYTALWVGRDGRPTLLVSDDDEPRVLRLQRSADGAWVERERVTDRWTWGMRFVPVAPNRHALLTYTANKQYSGEDLALRVLTREGGRLVAHAAIVARPMLLDDAPLTVGYVEGEDVHAVAAGAEVEVEVHVHRERLPVPVRHDGRGKC